MLLEQLVWFGCHDLSIPNTSVYRKPAKKVAQEAMVDVLKRLNKPPKRSADKFASQDELNNCTFNLDLKSVRASVVTTKRTEGKWQPPAKGWKPGNAPLTSRQSQVSQLVIDRFDLAHSMTLTHSM